MRIGLVGVGHWHAKTHAAAVLGCGAEISSVWDEDAAVAADFAAARGVPVAASVAAVLDGADLVMLMGRPDRLPAVVETALASGVPLVLEKPAAPDTATLATLAQKARAAGRFVAVPLANRFGPVMAEYRRLAGEGRAGALAHGHFRIVNGPPQRYRRDGVGWMCDPAIGGGGALRNLGIHGIDAALSLATGGLRVVFADVGKRIYRDEAIEDHAVVQLVDEAGVPFTVEAGYTYPTMAPGGDGEWRIAAANAYLVDRNGEASAATLDDGKRYALASTTSAERYRLFLADTLARIAAGRPPEVSLDDYVRAMELIDVAYGSART